MATYSTLDVAAEDALHTNRLLSTEDKQYKRISKKLFGKESPLVPIASKNSESKEGEAGDASTAEQSKEEAAPNYESWGEEVAMELVAFEASVVRSQFLLNSNAQERERYAAEKVRILETEQTVRDRNDQLRNDLADAQATLALRKTFDKLAEKITDNPLLKTRDEQGAEMQQLHDDIAELEREGEEYINAFEKRRSQFNKVCATGRKLVRIMRDEEEEELEHKTAKKGEGDEDDDEAQDEKDDQISTAATPAPADDAPSIAQDVDFDVDMSVSKQADELQPLSGENSDGQISDPDAEEGVIDEGQDDAANVT